MEGWKFGTVIEDEGARVMLIGRTIDPVGLASRGDWIGVTISPGDKWYTEPGQIEYVPEGEGTAWKWKIVHE